MCRRNQDRLPSRRRVTGVRQEAKPSRTSSYCARGGRMIILSTCLYLFPLHGITRRTRRTNEPNEVEVEEGNEEKRRESRSARPAGAVSTAALCVASLGDGSVSLSTTRGGASTLFIRRRAARPRRFSRRRVARRWMRVVLSLADARRNDSVNASRRSTSRSLSMTRGAV
jgi:hypothetical protein